MNYKNGRSVMQVDLCFFPVGYAKCFDKFCWQRKVGGDAEMCIGLQYLQ